MGNTACNKCSDVSLSSGVGAPKPLEASSSEEEDDDEEEEASSDGEMAEQEKKDAEASLFEGLKRGRTATFQQNIEHATSIGLDDEKIRIAQAKLEEHKAARRCEAYEADLKEFMETEECDDIAACQEKLSQGKNYGVKADILRQLEEKVADLEAKKELKSEEVENVKKYFETKTRVLVAACLKGRSTFWVDLSGGKAKKVTTYLDKVLRNFKVVGTPKGDLSCKVATLSARRAIEVAQVADSSAFKDLTPNDQNFAVAILPEGADPWCFLEGQQAKQDEVICGMLVLSRGAEVGLDYAAPTAPSARGKSPKKPKGLALKSGAAGEPEAEEDADAIASPRASPRGSSRNSPKKSKKSKTGEKLKVEENQTEELKPEPEPPAEKEEKEEKEDALEEAQEEAEEEEED